MENETFKIWREKKRFGQQLNYVQLEKSLSFKTLTTLIGHEFGKVEAKKKTKRNQQRSNEKCNIDLKGRVTIRT